MKIAIGIPAYNEEKNIAAIILKVKTLIVTAIKITMKTRTKVPIIPGLVIQFSEFTVVVCATVVKGRKKSDKIKICLL